MLNDFFTAKANDNSSTSGQPQWKQGNVILLLLFAAVALFTFSNTASLRDIEGEAALTQLLAGKNTAFYCDGHEIYRQAPGTIFLCRQMDMIFDFNSEMPLWVLRLFPALCSLGTVWLCYCMGKHLHSHRCGMAAGWLMTGSYGFLYWGRTAGAVSAGGFFALWAVWMLYGKKLSSWSFRRYCGLFMLLLFSFFYSSIPMVILILLLVTPKFFRRNFRKQHLNIRMAAAIFCAVICGALIVAIPFGVPVNSGKEAWNIFCTILGNWGQHHVDDMLANFNHRLHLSNMFNLPLLALPWLLYSVAAIAAQIKCQRLPLRANRMLYGVMIAAALSIVLPVLRWQHAYLLLPLVMVFTALGFESKYSSNFKWISLCDLIFRPLVILLAALLLALPLTAPLWQELLAVQPPLWLLILLPVSGIIALAILLRGRVAPREFTRWSGVKLKPGITIVAMTILTASLFMFGQPLLSCYRTDREFWLQSRQIMAKNDTDVLIYCGGTPDMDTLYYLNDMEIKTAANRQELAMLLKQLSGKKIMLTIKGRNREFPMPANAKLFLREKAPLAILGTSLTDRHELWALKATLSPLR